MHAFRWLDAARSEVLAVAQEYVEIDADLAARFFNGLLGVLDGPAARVRVCANSSGAHSPT